MKPNQVIKKLVCSGRPWSEVGERLEYEVARQEARNSRRSNRSRYLETRWGYTRINCEGL